MSLKLLACQINVPAMHSSAMQSQHLRRTTSLVDGILTGDRVDLVVLPELSSLDYSRKAFAELALLAEPAEGCSFAAWREIAIAHRCWVVYGFANKTNRGCSIATAVVNPEGVLAGIYHKLHLAQFGDSMEKEFFCAGQQQLLLIEINDFRIAPIICYDIRAPELCRTLVLEHHADFILHTGAYARDPSFYSWHAFAMTRAIENQVYLLSLNRAGEHFGHSIFCKPWSDEKNTPYTFDEHREHCEILTLEKSSIDTARSRYTFLDDKLASYDLPVHTAAEH